MSGKTAWAYAKENGLAPQTFTNWTKSEGKTKQAFVEIPAQTPQSTRHHKALTIEKGEIKIHIPLTVDGDELLLQQGTQTAEGGMVGRERVLAGTKEAGKRQVPVA